MLNINQLPENALREVFSLVPALDLILCCRLVCSLWRDIIDCPALWITKCQRMGYISKHSKQKPCDWKIFYYICSLKKNLLRNACAEDGFDFWKLEKNGGNRWKVEELPGAEGHDFPDKQVKKYFVTSYRSCKKSQLIELRKKGYQNSLMDSVQPDIVIKDWFAPRRDCGCRYEVLVRLLSQNKSILQEFCPEPVFIERWSDGQWQQMTHIFHNYGPGVRYIYFLHGGQDIMLWAGWYGVRVTNSSVTIELEGPSG